MKRSGNKPALLTVVFAASLLALSVQAASRSGNNAINGVDLLSGYNKLWTPGATWNTGTPTAFGAPILQRNIQYVVDLAKTRTQAQEMAAYYDDRRDQSYSLISGLGSLANGYLAGSGAFTTIPVFDASTQTTKYNDNGNGAGDANSQLGKVVQLVQAIRNDASTTPAKNAYQYPRPWRQASVDIVPLSLRPALSTTPQSDGGFPSGHTNAAYLAAMGFGYAVPQRLGEELFRASELGNNRIVAGMHSPLDVIGGRITATYFAIDNLVNNAQLRSDAFAQAQAYFAQQCGGDINNCVDRIDPATDQQSQHAQDKALYTARMTYGFAPVGPTNLAPVVPVNAEVLLETRFPYLTASQRRDILASTELSSGYVVIDESNGYGRLNLMAAADGYAAFTGNVSVNLDASQGGFNARDAWRNDIAGSGSLTKNGSGELTLSGFNTYSGGTVINGGTLRGHAQAFGSGDITDNATLVLDQSVNDSLANNLHGSGSLVKTGVGSLSLTGNSDFSGTTSVNQGRLAINGNLGNSAVTVNSGATLGGNGSLGSLRVAQGGVLAPGNSVGQLNVNGNVTLDQGSVYQVETDATGRADRLVANGSITVNGATLALVSSPYWQPRGSYQLLSAGNGLSGRFGPIQSDFAFLTPTLGYGANQATLSLARNGVAFADLAEGRNARAAAAGLDRAGVGNALWNQVAATNAAGAGSTFQSLGNELHASTKTVLVENSRLVRTAMSDRLSDAQDELPSSSGIQGLAGSRERGLVWTQALGAWGRNDGSHDASSLDSHSRSLLIGSDVPLDSGWRVGGLVGFGHTDLDLRGESGSADSTDYHLGLYAGQRWDALSLKLGLAHSWHQVEARRNLAILGNDQRLAPDYDAGTSQAFGELAYRIERGSLSLEPFANLAQVHLQTDAFRERSGALELDSRRQTTDATFSTLGLRLAAKPLGGLKVVPSATLGWRHAFGDTTPEQESAFAGGPDFKLVGAPIARDAAVVRGALDLTLSETVSLGLGYDGQLSSHAKDQDLDVRLSWRF
ncbi:autotransporter domain-containing protein [Pseudomonas sp. AS2.8]|uniref:autotransporter domain-containing protein n=1 Tax=Pseudomonas sp. AS2.8 TaxID=2587128 RepID=UPI0017C1AA4D|nr:autotransporter domain-containing protein [Pseudomonas sp. AS2.8]MBB2895287.1 outer membrane autotransporter protein [Pseudomonas sp. AS2.8]